jgi:very-short-patch-repair endonuclease
MSEDALSFLSSLEQKVYLWLTRKNIFFNTQETMFGYSGEVGSATVDFIVPDRNLAIRIMGSYYHSTFEAKARDLLGKERLLSSGYQVVDIREESLADEKIENTMKLALLGQEALM